jgi:hypothetical protein
MKTLQDFKEHLAQERGFKTWQQLVTAGGYEYIIRRLNEANERYAAYREQKAAEEAFDSGCNLMAQGILDVSLQYRSHTTRHRFRAMVLRGKKPTNPYKQKEEQ